MHFSCIIKVNIFQLTMLSIRFQLTFVAQLQVIMQIIYPFLSPPLEGCASSSSRRFFFLPAEFGGVFLLGLALLLLFALIILPYSKFNRFHRYNFISLKPFSRCSFNLFTMSKSCPSLVALGKPSASGLGTERHI